MLANHFSLHHKAWKHLYGVVYDQTLRFMQVVAEER